MTTYGNLQNRFKHLQDQEAKYWQRLGEVLGEIVEGVSGLLNFGEDAKEKLRLGYIAQKEFKVGDLSALPRRNRHIEFALELTLSDQESVIPPARIVVSARLEGDADAGFRLLSDFGNEKLSTYQQAAEFLVNSFSRELDRYDPSKRSDIFK